MINLLDIAVETDYYDTTYGKYSTIICGILIFIFLIIAFVAFKKLNKKENKTDVAFGSKIKLDEEKNVSEINNEEINESNKLSSDDIHLNK